MKYFIRLGFALILLKTNIVIAQQSTESLKSQLRKELPDSSRIDLLEKLSLSLMGSNPAEAILYAETGMALSTEIKDQRRKAKMLNAIGIGYFYRGEYLETLINWDKALKEYEAINDPQGIANILSNIGSVYEATGDQVKALDFHLRSLRIGEKNNDSIRIATATQNIGVVYNNLGEPELSISYYIRSLELCKLLKYEQCIGLSYLNMSEVYSHRDSLELASEYADRAVKIFKSNNDPLLPSAIITTGRYKYQQGDYYEALVIAKDAYEVGKQKSLKSTMQLACNLKGKIYLHLKDYNQAISNFSEAIKIGEIIGENEALVEAYKGFIVANDDLKNYRIAGIAKDSLINISKKIFNIERDNSLSNLQLEYDLEKRNSEITLLNKEREIQELTLSKAIRNRNVFGVLSVLMIFFSALTYWLYQKVNVARKQSDDLLLNILPAQTAEELKEKGYTTARSHDNVAIMFTDFEGFSKIAQQLNSRDLVESIDVYFRKFDEICSKFKIEKIKTIGDSYLAASGLDDEGNDVSQIVRAALEMQKFVSEMLDNPAKEIKQPFPMRIGVHVGPLVAGVVGIKKFQYDIWGNSVNIASRVESSSIAGKVAISESVFDVIKSLPEYDFEKRDEINVKNIGNIQTYFVNNKNRL